MKYRRRIPGVHAERFDASNPGACETFLSEHFDPPISLRPKSFDQWAIRHDGRLLELIEHGEIAVIESGVIKAMTADIFAATYEPAEEPTR